MVHSAIEKGSKVESEIHSMMALSMAKAAAIASGQVLSGEEMSHLVDTLLTSTSPNYTPDGKLALTVLHEDEIEKMFRSTPVLEL